MQSDIAAQIITQDHEELKPIVSQIVADEVLGIGDVTATKIGRSAGHATAGIFLVHGQAQTQAGERTWSAIVKALGEPENPSPGTDDDPFRELSVYRSGVFADLCGGMRAARYYAIQPRDNLQLLWLEDLSAAPQPPWTADQFVETARHLGQFNAHWSPQTLPTWDWLSQRGFRARFTGNSGFQAAFERVPAQQDQALMQTFALAPAVETLHQLWAQCDKLLIQAEVTTKGVCHLDCHPKNLFPMHDSNGTSYTIGIDWVKVGVANLGIDVGHLLASPMTWLEVTSEEAQTLRDPMFHAYLTGLADSGWAGNEDEVRLTYLTRLACEAIRNTALVSQAIERVEWLEVMERLIGQPIAAICARYHENLTFYLDCIDEAGQVAARI